MTVIDNYHLAESKKRNQNHNNCQHITKIISIYMKIHTRIVCSCCVFFVYIYKRLPCTAHVCFQFKCDEKEKETKRYK